MADYSARQQAYHLTRNLQVANNRIIALAQEVVRMRTKWTGLSSGERQAIVEALGEIGVDVSALQAMMQALEGVKDEVDAQGLQPVASLIDRDSALPEITF